MSSVSRVAVGVNGDSTAARRVIQGWVDDFCCGTLEALATAFFGPRGTGRVSITVGNNSKFALAPPPMVWGDIVVVGRSGAVYFYDLTSGEFLQAKGSLSTPDRYALQGRDGSRLLADLVRKAQRVG